MPNKQALPSEVGLGETLAPVGQASHLQGFDRLALSKVRQVSTLSATDLSSILTEVGVTDPSAPGPNFGSPGCAVHVLSTVVVKVADVGGGSRFGREVEALKHVNGQPACPTLLGVGDFDDRRSWLVMSRVPGQPHPDAARPAHQLSDELAEILGRLAAGLHNGPRPPGFGTWKRDPGISLRDEQLKRIDALDQLTSTSPTPWCAVARQAVSLLRSWVGTVSLAPDQPVLTHRDLQPRNALIESSGRGWLVDFDAAGGGDPAEDFSRIALDWRTSAYRRFCDSYRGSGTSLGEGAEARVAFYTLYWAALILARAGLYFPDYVAPAKTAFSRLRSGELPSAP